ncbi:MAG: MBL fold metallo-hydrolase [Candidatus Thiodiazotropha endolucinida]
MKLRIHRGAAEIGGNCIEIESSGQSILLDLGAPLIGDRSPQDALPTILGLTDGTNPNLLGIIISHPHADHYGLVGLAHPSVPVYIGMDAANLLRAALAFAPFGANFPNVIHYRHRKTIQLGPFRITPYLNDHSAFDAYSFLVEANGRTLFYSGDIRGHGWKSRMFDQLLADGPKGVDVMLLEGTTLGRDEERRSESEADLVGHLAKSIASNRGLVLATFSGQNIDRFVTFYKATRSTRRNFVVDLYVAHLLRALRRKSLPDPTSNALRVYLPRRTKLKIVRDRSFDLVSPYHHRRIYPHELRKRKKHLVMSFRPSMAQDLEKADCLEGAKLIYSMWPGYIERSTYNVRDWCAKHSIEFEIIHTSGHADVHDLKLLVNAIHPKNLIPIHTFTPDRFDRIGENVTRVADGEWFEP